MSGPSESPSTNWGEWIAGVQAHRLGKVIRIAVLFGFVGVFWVLLGLVLAWPLVAVPALALCGWLFFKVFRGGRLGDTLLRSLPQWVPGVRMDPGATHASVGSVHELVLPLGTPAWLTISRDRVRLEVAVPWGAVGEPAFSWRSPIVAEALEVFEGLGGRRVGDQFVLDRLLAVETLPAVLVDALGALDGLGREGERLSALAPLPRALAVLESQSKEDAEDHLRQWARRSHDPLSHTVLTSWAGSGRGPTRVQAAVALGDDGAELLVALSGDADGPTRGAAVVARIQGGDDALRESLLSGDPDVAVLRAVAATELPEAEAARRRLAELATRTGGALTVQEAGEEEGGLAVVDGESAAGRLAVKEPAGPG